MSDPVHLLAAKKTELLCRPIHYDHSKVNIVSDDFIDGCAEVVKYGGQQLTLFINRPFFAKLMKSDAKTSELLMTKVLAHELGHYIYAHACSWSGMNWEDEVHADVFAGVVINKSRLLSMAQVEQLCPLEHKHLYNSVTPDSMLPEERLGFFKLGWLLSKTQGMREASHSVGNANPGLDNALKNSADQYSKHFESLKAKFAKNDPNHETFLKRFPRVFALYDPKKYN